MKQSLIILFALAFFTINLDAMENQQECENMDIDPLRDLKTAEASNGYFGVSLPNELTAKIFDYANDQEAQEIIGQIYSILVEETIILSDDEFRHFTNPAFNKIAGIIKNASTQTYTRIAVFIASGNSFSLYEKLHFVSIMLLKNLTVNQKIILEFLARTISHFEKADIAEQVETKTPMCINDLMSCALSTKTPTAEIIVKFLHKIGAILPDETIWILIGAKNCHLIEWAIKNGASLKGLTLEQIKQLTEPDIRINNDLSLVLFRKSIIQNFLNKHL